MIPENIEQVKRSQIRHFLNTTPKADSEKWDLLGVGITDYGIAFGASVSSEKWIIEDVARNTVDSYNKSGGVTQTCYKGDPVFEYINDLRRRSAIGADCNTQVIDIDLYDFIKEEDTETIKYNATKNDCAIEITNYAEGEKPSIQYTIHYNGDPILGIVTIADGVPTFVEEA